MVEPPLWKIWYSQIGNLPQVFVKRKNMWNHHLVIPKKAEKDFLKIFPWAFLHPPGPTTPPRAHRGRRGRWRRLGLPWIEFHLGWRVLIITLPQINKKPMKMKWLENDIFFLGGGWPVFSSYVSFREFKAFDPSQTWVNYMDYIAMEALQCTYHISSYVNVRHWRVTNMYIYTHTYIVRKCCTQMYAYN